MSHENVALDWVQEEDNDGVWRRYPEHERVLAALVEKMDATEYAPWAESGWRWTVWKPVPDAQFGVGLAPSVKGSTMTADRAKELADIELVRLGWRLSMLVPLGDVDELRTRWRKA